MQAFSILSVIVAGLKLAKKYWPVVTVIVAMLGKMAAGDTSGIPEALSAIVAAFAAVNSGKRADRAEKAVEEAAKAAAIAGVLAASQRAAIAPGDLDSAPRLMGFDLGAGASETRAGA